VSGALELAFGVDVGAVTGVGVNERGVQHEPVAIGKNQVFRKDVDGGFSGNASWSVGLHDAALDGSADGNHGLAVDDHRLRDYGGERISSLRTEGCERGFEFHLDGGAGGQGGL